MHNGEPGSARITTSATGVITGTATWDQYGNATAITGACPQSDGPAKYGDTETGLIYMRARYYDPVTTQFLNRDPAEALTRSAYGYVNGNPLNATDPLGLWSLKDHWRGIAQGLAVAAVVTAGVATLGVGAAVIVASESGASSAIGVGLTASVIGIGSSLLGAGQTYLTCRYGSESACAWSATTSSVSLGSGVVGFFAVPGLSALAGLGASVASLFNPHWSECNTTTRVDPTRNPDGSFRSGGQSPGMDPAGVPVDPRTVGAI